jgi:hypothetical protein
MLSQCEEDTSESSVRLVPYPDGFDLNCLRVNTALRPTSCQAPRVARSTRLGCTLGLREAGDAIIVVGLDMDPRRRHAGSAPKTP